MVSAEPRQPHRAALLTARPRPGLIDDEAGVIRIEPGLAVAAEPADDERPVERAYRGIRRAILTGELRPGDHLREEPLAAMTGTSRTPVREALRRLVAEGLATAENRHRFVAEFTDEEVLIVFEVRARLESYVAQVAARKITADELAALERLVLEIDAIDPADPAAADRFMALNSAFHAGIVAATRSRQLKQMIAQAVSLPLVHIKQFVWDQRINIARSNAQHRDILAALATGNADWAAAAMAGHVLSTRPRPRNPGTRHPAPRHPAPPRGRAP